MIKKKGAHVQKAQQDNTPHSQARLQRGQTEGRDFTLLHKGNIQSASAITTPAYDKGSSNLPCGVQEGFVEHTHSNECLSNLHYVISYASVNAAV